MGNCLCGKSARFIFLIFLLIMADIRAVSAQWVKQSPLPTGEEITDICFISPDTGWIFGLNGTVLNTTDGGNSWADQSIPTDDRINFGLFLDRENGWLALSGGPPDYNGKIYGTSDGGKHWDIQYSDPAGVIRSMSFINPDTGWALAYLQQSQPFNKSWNYFLKTTDGGESWFLLDFLEQSHFRKVDFIDDTTGYVTGAGTPNLMKTVDGGLNWQATPHSSNAGLTDIFFTDINNGYSCGNNFYFTHNAGASWDYTYCYHANSVGMYDSLNGWTASIDKVFKVSNGGLDVNYQFTVDKSLLVDISVVDSANAFISGKFATIYATHDGSETWQEISNGTHNSLFSIFFLNELEGWAGGADRTLLNTRNGGKHWTYKNVNAPSNAITDIQFVNPATGWFVNGEIYLTIDSGKSWNPASGLSYPVKDLYFLNDTLGWCCGAEGRLFKSVNGGLNWEERNSGTGKELNAVYFTDDNEGWIAGEGLVSKTSDGGATWEESYTGLTAFSKIQFTDAINGFILAESFYLRTQNGGEAWNVVVPEGMIGPGFLEDICFVNQNTGYLSGGNYLLKTIDGGVTWNNDLSQPAINCHAIFFIDESKGWMAGEKGVIFHTETGGTFSVIDPADGQSSCQYIISPNPSKDIFRINYLLEKTADVEIGIYTLQGTVISYYHETGASPGNYTFAWDPAFFSPGIYLCKIRIGENSRTEKIFLIN